MNFTKDYFDLGGTVYYYNKVDKLPETKENAAVHFLAMVCRSWTFDRMTDREKHNAIDAILFTLEQSLLSGSFNQRWKQLQAVYNAFLLGLGYDGPNWREPDEDAPF